MIAGWPVGRPPARRGHRRWTRPGRKSSELCEGTVDAASLLPRRTVSETRRQVRSIDRSDDMTTSDPKKEPKTAKADEASIRDLPESKDSRELTPDEEKQLV